MHVFDAASAFARGHEWITLALVVGLEADAAFFVRDLLEFESGSAFKRGFEGRMDQKFGKGTARKMGVVETGLMLDVGDHLLLYCDNNFITALLKVFHPIGIIRLPMLQLAQLCCRIENS